MTSHARYEEALTGAERELPTHRDLVDERIVIAYYAAALTFITISMLAGLLVALQMVRGIRSGASSCSRPAGGG